MNRLLAAVLAALLCLMTPTSMVFAQDAPATEEEFDRLTSAASEAYEAGDYSEAIARFEEAYELKSVSNILYNIARIHEDAGNIDEAITLANNSRFGLSAGVFTQDLDAAVKFARHVQSGNIQINWGPMWRADLMPYGGLKESGMGKEGPKYAIEEMTEMKTVVIH